MSKDICEFKNVHFMVAGDVLYKEDDGTPFFEPTTLFARVLHSGAGCRSGMLIWTSQYDIQDDFEDDHKRYFSSYSEAEDLLHRIRSKEFASNPNTSVTNLRVVARTLTVSYQETS